MQLVTISWPFLALIIILAGGLIAFFIWKNRQDRKKFENFMNRDYRKSKDEEGENDVTDTKT